MRRSLDSRSGIERARQAAQSVALKDADRREHLLALLDHVKWQTQVKSGRGRQEEDTLASLQAIKLLGRSAGGSEVLATAGNLQTLAVLAGVDSTIRVAAPTAIHLESWRIICNAAKLHDSAAKVLENVENFVKHALKCIAPSTSPLVQFLASRCLFLMTAKGGEFNRTIVEHYNIAGSLHESFKHYLVKMLEGEGTLNADDVTALSEHLKLLYNLAIFYPRLQALDPVAQSSAAQTSPNLESASPRFESQAMSPSLSSGSSSGSNSSKLSRSMKSVRSMLPSGRATSPPSRKRPHRTLDSLSPDLIQIAIAWPVSTEALSPLPPLSHALHCLSVASCDSRWFDDYPTASRKAFADHLERPSSVPQTLATPLCPLVAKLFAILESHLAYCFPADSSPDDSDARSRIDKTAGESDHATVLDSAIAPLILLLRKCVIGDADKGTGEYLRKTLLEDADRSQPLDRGSTTTGRLVRLMGSIYYPSTKVGSGELLFVLCRQDPEDFARMLGYGLAAGFLASNGLLVPPPEVCNKDGPEIDAITGAYKKDTPSTGEAMSDAEKEREAEKLYVLFDRLAKNGAMQVENPMRTAQEQGRFEELANDPSDDEDADEREANAEMARWKNRRKNVSKE